MRTLPMAHRRAGAATRSPDARLPGILWWTVGTTFLLTLMIGTSMAPSYDISGGAISDLGVIPETAAFFNVSLVVVGLLNALAGLLDIRQTRGLGTLAIVLLASAGAAGAGLVPLDRGGVHGVSALVAFVAFNLQALAYGRRLPGPLRWLSFLAGATGLAFVGLMLIGDLGDPAVFGPIGHGGAERMIVYPVMLWMLAFGGAMMVRPASASSEAEPAAQGGDQHH